MAAEGQNTTTGSIQTGHSLGGANVGEGRGEQWQQLIMAFFTRCSLYVGTSLEGHILVGERENAQLLAHVSRPLDGSVGRSVGLSLARSVPSRNGSERGDLISNQYGRSPPDRTGRARMDGPLIAQAQLECVI